MAGTSPRTGEALPDLALYSPSERLLGASMPSRLRIARRSASALSLIVLILVAGCGPSLPRTYSVRGRIDHVDGDVADLADANIEAVLESDNMMRASGTIASDGTFDLEMVLSGVLVRGALEGDYRARIVLTDDGGKEATRKRRAAISPRFLSTTTSGMSFKVPPSEEVVLKVSRRS